MLLLRLVVAVAVTKYPGIEVAVSVAVAVAVPTVKVAALALTAAKVTIAAVASMQETVFFTILIIFPSQAVTKSSGLLFLAAEVCFFG